MRIRLDKYLADMGIGTRSEVKRYIQKGMVLVGDETIKKPEHKINTDSDAVCFQNQLVGYETEEYYLLNKPAGVVSATSDKKERTVLDLIESKKRKDLFPVGRLDKDTEGLLLITNDGDLCHRLLSPKKHVDKVYYAKVDGRVTEADVILFAKGVDIGEKELTKPGQLVIRKSGDISEIELTICEGKFHQVKRMFEAVQKKVIYLKRIRMGSLTLEETLPVGEYRKLTQEEIRSLKEC
ncbi:MAG: pseudouridine synthase [Hespellia sp.]|nr:pseudouridine synthase [Hespellia sp.]